MALDAVLVITALCLVESMLLQRRKDWTNEMGFLSVVFLIPLPLAGFAVYFCLVHSMRHFSAMGEVFGQFRRCESRNHPVFSLLTWAVGLLVFVNERRPWA